jgi:hypothetical protein
VYDRRSADRRQTPSTPAEATGNGDRTFVDEDGEEWRVVMRPGDFFDESPAALEQQLARAKKSE